MRNRALAVGSAAVRRRLEAADERFTRALLIVNTAALPRAMALPDEGEIA